MAKLSMDERTVLLVVGTQDRHQRRLVAWARRADSLIRVALLSSTTAALEFLRALEHPSKTSVIIYVRSLSTSSDDQQLYQTTERLVTDFKKKLIIWETPYSESPFDYFKIPRRTKHTFLLPGCRSLRPMWYYRGTITVYPYLLIGVFLSDLRKQGPDILDQLRDKPENWQSWVLEVSPIKPKPKMHTLFDGIVGTSRIFQRTITCGL